MNPDNTTPSDEYDLRMAAFWLAFEAAPDGAAKEAARADFCARNPDLQVEVSAQLGLRSRIEPETVPERIERFPIRRVIDRGGMGRVFEAEQEPLGRRVAVKTIRGDRNDVLHRVRFENERRTLARLHHTNIVPIYAGGREGQLDYYAMPLIDGASLRRVVDEARRLATSDTAASLPGLTDLVRLACLHAVDSQAATNEAIVWNPSPDYLRSVVEVMADAADALEHAHRQGYLHRDVKPSNIMVDLRGHCWVVDFGLAPLRDSTTEVAANGEANGHTGTSDPGAARDSESEQYQAALTSGNVGTPAYMAPEQRQGQADARSDVWGLGVTFYELLTGRQARPDQGSGADSPPPRALVPRLPRDLDAICRKATRADPSQRYTTAGDLRDDLRCWLDRRPTRARPMWPLHRAWLWARRDKGWAAALLVTVTALISGGVIRGKILADAAVAEAAAANFRAAEAEAHSRELERESLIQRIERLRLSAHRDGWSAKAWDLVRHAAAVRTDDALQYSAAGGLAGHDARLVQEFKEFGAASLAFDRDGRRLLIGKVVDPKPHSGPDKLLPSRLWDFSSRTTTTFTTAAMGPVAFRGDGRPVRLVPGTEKDGPAVILLDLPQNKPLSRFIAPGGATFELAKGDLELTTLTLTPDASVVAAVLQRPDKGQVLVAWDGVSGRSLGSLEPDIPVRCIAVSPDGSLVAAGQEKGRIVIWSPATSRTIAVLDNGRNRLNCLSFGRDVRRPEPAAPGSDTPHWLLAAGDSGGTVTVWDLARHMIGSFCRGSDYDVYNVAFSPDGATLASCGRGAATLWDLRYGRTLLNIKSPAQGDFQLSLAFVPNGRGLAFGSWTVFGPGRVEVWELDNGRGIQTLYGLRGRVEWTCFSRDGRRLAGLSQTFEVGVWDVRTGRLLRLFDAPVGLYADNAGLAFSGDGRRFALASAERATLWDIETGAALGSWTLPAGLCDRLAFEGPDCVRLLRSETKSGKVPPTSEYKPKDHPRVLRLRRLTVPDRMEVVREISDFNIHVFDAAVTPDGSTFVEDGVGDAAGGTVSRSFKAFDGATGRELWSVPVRSKIDTAGFMLDPGGRVLCRPDENDGGRVLPPHLTDVRTGAALGHIDPHPGILGPGAIQWFSRDLNELGSTLNLMEKGHDRPRLRIPAPDNVGHSAFSPDGLHVALCCPDGTVTVLDLAEIPRRLAEFHMGW